MARRRVFIVWSHPLSHESVRLLLNHPDVEVVGATSDYLTARNEIARLQPDTVIVEEPAGGASAEALALLESSRRVTRVIGFSLDDNKLSVYRREERTAARAEDLLRLVNSD
jgi:DNA-binding NarL/FixJ family response regulator